MTLVNLASVTASPEPYVGQSERGLVRVEVEQPETGLLIRVKEGP